MTNPPERFGQMSVDRHFTYEVGCTAICGKVSRILVPEIERHDTAIEAFGGDANYASACAALAPKADTGSAVSLHSDT